MQTSTDGIAALELEEGVVLRAYRDAVGRWTIGPGLTAASGVVRPVAGMVISLAKSRELTSLALRQNYEPAVAQAMPGAAQHEFDAGVLFHWNTGAIARASWVPLWVKKAAQSAIAAKFRLWNKGGGRVLPGLVKRRDRELRILFEAIYPALAEPKSKSVSIARWALPLDIIEKAKIAAEFARLGYGYRVDDLVGIDAAGIPAAEVRRFQGDHALTQDGVIGRATLSTLQRRIDAAARAKPAAAAAGTTAPVAATVGGAPDLTDQIAGADWALPLLAAAALLWCVWLAWSYRDVIAAKIVHRLPRVAAFLRSF